MKEYEVCQLTAWFARMWGVMESLGDLPQQDFENMINSLISWAEEFLKKGEQDPILFFQQKMKASCDVTGDIPKWNTPGFIMKSIF